MTELLEPRRSAVVLRPADGERAERERKGAATKVLVVLEAFSAQGGSISLAELTDRTGLPKSTAHRMLRFLRDAEFVESVDGYYHLSSKVSMLSAGRPAVLSPATRVNLMPYLAELYELTHELVQLVVRVGSNSHVIERLHSYRSSTLAVHRGEDQPLHRTAAGKALAAGSAQADWWWVPDRQRAVFENELSTVRASGVAYERGCWRSGVSGVAVPLRDGKQDVIAAIAIVGPTGRFRPEAVAPRLRKVALAASRELLPTTRAGYSGDVAS